MCWYRTKKTGSNLGIARGVGWEYSETMGKELNLTGEMKLKKKKKAIVANILKDLVHSKIENGGHKW